MSLLVLELRQGEMMVVNGATIRFRNKCRIELVSHARFLFGKQIMPVEQAETATHRLYLSLQTAYAGAPEERPAAAADVRLLLGRLRKEAQAEDRQELEIVSRSFEREDFHGALKTLRQLIRKEGPASLSEASDP